MKKPLLKRCLQGIEWRSNQAILSLGLPKLYAVSIGNLFFYLKKLGYGI